MKLPRRPTIRSAANAPAAAGVTDFVETPAPAGWGQPAYRKLGETRHPVGRVPRPGAFHAVRGVRGCFFHGLLTRCLLGGLLAFVSAKAAEQPATLGPTAKASPPSVRDFEHFRLIAQRTLFDPARRKPLPSGRQSEGRPEPVQTQSLTLTGAICYEGKAFAFFDSTEPDCCGVFSSGDQVGEWTLARVDTRGVRLEGGEKPLEFVVGRSVSRRGETPWEVSEAVVTTRPSRTTAGATGDRDDATSGESTVAADSAVPASLSDVMKKMMERRRQQESQ